MGSHECGIVFCIIIENSSKDGVVKEGYGPFRCLYMISENLYWEVSLKNAHF